MPKIRGIKPDYWTDEDIVDLSIPARLLFIGLWSYACDNGHLQDKPKQIKMRVLPGDDVNCSELLRELESAGRIDRSSGWITIPNFTKHQKPDRRYFQTCDQPDCTKPKTDSQPETRGGHSETTPSTPRDHAVGSMGPRGDGDGEGEGELKVSGSKPRTRGHQLPDTWRPNDQHRSFAAENRINLERELAKFRDHHLSKGSVMKDWDAAFRKWLRNAQEWRGEAVGPIPARPTAPHVSEIESPPDGLTPQEYFEWDEARRQRRAAGR